MNNFGALIISVTITLLWVSLWLSTQPIPVNQTDVQRYMDAYLVPVSDETSGTSIATVLPVPLPLSGRGGFPLPAFKYPVSPLGGDIPNADAFFPFLLNLGFWIAMTTVLLWFVPRRWMTSFVIRVSTGLACLMTIFGIGFLLLKFD